MGRAEAGFTPDFPEDDAITSGQYDALQAQAAAARSQEPGAAVSSNDDLPDPKEFARAIMGENWMTEAACRGATGVFFMPERKELKDERELREARAKAVCRQCRVVESCLEYALANNEKDGIWGGLNEKERQRIQDQRRRRSA